MRAQSIKTIGSSGQISLGKEYAGQMVMVEEIEKGVWLIKAARIIPESELFLHQEPAKSRIDQAIAWSRENKPAETDLEKLSEKIG